MHWKSWEFMCSAKNKGDLSFKDFASQNSTLLSKKSRRYLQNPNGYWALILRGIYWERERFWEVKPNAEISWVWRSMLHGKNLLKNNGK